VNSRPRSFSRWFDILYGFFLGFTSSEHLQQCDGRTAGKYYTCTSLLDSGGRKKICMDIYLTSAYSLWFGK
jgi:hypothetical protein